MIASEAGIALPTLYAHFQSKRGLLEGVMHRLISNEPGAPPKLETAGPRAVAAEPDARRALHLLVIDLTGVQERVIPIYEVMKSAARTEPEVAKQLAGMQQYRFKNLESFARRLDELGALRPGLSVEDASHTLWAIASPEVRQVFLQQAGWTPDRYRDWLEQTLAAALLCHE
jgi:AcrR family transcriptional regulator